MAEGLTRQDVIVPYAIEELGPLEFERMVQALLLCDYGSTVQVFGTGADDGRDATFEGSPSPQQAAATPQSWRGYHVFQVKFRERPGSPRDNKTWLLSQVRAELRAWSETIVRDGKREFKRKGPRPEYFIVVTNVGLSGQVGGGLDAVESAIRDHAAEPKNNWPLKDCQVWDRTKVERLLDAHASVRQRFNGLLTAGDVVAALEQGAMTLPSLPLEETLPVLEEHARIELAHGGKVKLGEAGQVANERLDLAGVAVDLPAHLEGEPDPAKDVRVLRHVLDVGNRIQRPTVRGESSPHLLLLGGPGQGKTTLGRILVQSYRAALLADRPLLTTDVRQAVDASLERAEQIGLPRIANRRWPFRIDLAEYASHVAGGAPPTLTTYIASRINDATGQDFTPISVRRWLRAWPWLLVLDGYDEVASASAREQIAGAVNALLQTAQSEDADLLIVATTRPQGYGDELPQALHKLELLSLSREDAIAYATRLTDMRLGKDAERSEVIDRITAAVDNDVTGRLMRTPLQVMILTLLLESRRRPPQDRAALFQSYYDVIYDREQQKKNYLSDVLQDYRQDVDAIHHTVGLTLQVRSEDTEGDFDAAMAADEFREIVRHRLEAQEHTGAELGRLVDDLTKAARDRLVLLAASGQDLVSFDLRSIQEYMAAKALTAGSERDVLANLTAIAPSAYWRNTWLLAVGVLYHEKPHLFDQMLQSMRNVDSGENDWLSLLVATGPRLAAEVLDDGVAARNPRHLRHLIVLAMEALDGANIGAARLGAILADLPDLNDMNRTVIIDGIERALKAGPENRAAAVSVLRGLARSQRTGPLFTKARQLLSAHTKRSGSGQPGEMPGSVTFADALPAAALTWHAPSAPAGFRDELRKIETTRDHTGRFELPGHIPLLASAFEVVADPPALQIVVEAIRAIDEQNWTARAAITSILWRARQRLPVAYQLSGVEVSPRQGNLSDP